MLLPYQILLNLRPPATVTAKSAYWRMFFTQMQEDSLEEDRKRREQEQGKEAQKGTVEAEKAKPVTKPKPKPRTERKSVSGGSYLAEVPPVKAKPFYVTKQPAVDHVTPFLRIVSNQFHDWQKESEPIVAAMFDRKAKLDAEADEEESIHLLLLAA